MSLVDSIFWLSETILGKVYYDGSSSVDKALSSEAIRVSKQMNDQSLGLTRELMKHESRMNLEMHFQQLITDLNGSHRESQRDMFDQMNKNLQNIIITASVLFAALTTIITQGELDDPNEAFLVLYSTFCSMSFLCLFLSIVFSVEALRTLSQFMYHKGKQQQATIHRILEDTEADLCNLDLTEDNSNDKGEVLAQFGNFSDLYKNILRKYSEMLRKQGLDLDTGVDAPVKDDLHNIEPSKRPPSHKPLSIGKKTKQKKSGIGVRFGIFPKDKRDKDVNSLGSWGDDNDSEKLTGEGGEIDRAEGDGILHSKAFGGEGHYTPVNSPHSTANSPNSPFGEPNSHDPNTSNSPNIPRPPTIDLKGRNLNSFKSTDFVKFWDENCKLEDTLARCFLYVGGFFLILSVIIFMWCRFARGYSSRSGAVIAAVFIGISLPISILFLAYGSSRWKSVKALLNDYYNKDTEPINSEPLFPSS